MYALIQNGHGLFGTGRTKIEAIENASEWTSDPLSFGANDGEFTVVPMLAWDEESQRSLQDVIEIVGNDGFDYDSNTGLFFSIHRDVWPSQDFCDEDGISMCYLKQPTNLPTELNQ